MDAHKASFSILMFPWLAEGHVSPFLELANNLSKRNFQIYFCSTPIVLSSLNHKINDIRINNEKEKIHALPIQLVELHLPSSPELPPHLHTTKGLPRHLNSTLQKALRMSRPSFSDILKTLTPDLLIFDALQPWAEAESFSQNISSAVFLISSAASFSFLFHISNNPGVDYPFPSIYLRDYEVETIRRMFADFKSIEEKENKSESNLSSCSLILIRSCREIDGKYIDYVSRVFKKRVLPTGPFSDCNYTARGDEDTEVMEWLGKKEKSSTVFVSFGSEHFCSKEEIEEIAHGLELSGVFFIWVVRFPIGEENVNVQEVLPEGFLERIGDRGLVMDGWAPQKRILGHSSCGGFVSHCGWNSVMESIKLGVPIIAVPVRVDQPTNARLVAELGVGMEVLRGRNGAVRREEVAKVVREVVVEKGGEGLRRKARELSDNIRLEGEQEIDEVVKALMQVCGKNNNNC